MPGIRRRLGAVFLLLAILIMTVSAVVIARQPSLTRQWDEDVRVLTGVEPLPGGAVRLTQVRDWRYTTGAVASKEYFAERFDPSDVAGLWMYEQELGLGGRIAHTFLVFEFPESSGRGRWLGISVETRREAGETYSLLRGVMRGFELTHIWATEEDLVRRRVEYLDYPLTRYRVEIPADQVAALFRQFVEETRELATTPRWYNTLTTNCTSSLISYVNEVKPGAIPLHYSFVLTGRADSNLIRLGYVDPGSARHITREWLAAHPLR